MVAGSTRPTRQPVPWPAPPAPPTSQIFPPAATTWSGTKEPLKDLTAMTAPAPGTPAGARGMARAIGAKLPVTMTTDKPVTMPRTSDRRRFPTIVSTWQRPGWFPARGQPPIRPLSGPD